MNNRKRFLLAALLLSLFISAMTDYGYTNTMQRGPATIRWDNGGPIPGNSAHITNNTGDFIKAELLDNNGRLLDTVWIQPGYTESLTVPTGIHGYSYVTIVIRDRNGKILGRYKYIVP